VEDTLMDNYSIGNLFMRERLILKRRGRVKMKKLLLIAIVLLLALTAVACKSPTEKAEEAVTEKIVEKGLGVDNVDIDDGEVTIEGKDGKKINYGGTEWPDNDIARTIPKLKKGNINSVISSDGGVMIGMDQVEKEDFDDYLGKIKEIFAENAVESNADGFSAYSAGNGDGLLILINYDAGMGVLDISLSTVME